VTQDMSHDLAYPFFGCGTTVQQTHLTLQAGYALIIAFGSSYILWTGADAACVVYACGSV
jgi:hypothetical protein